MDLSEAMFDLVKQIKAQGEQNIAQIEALQKEVEKLKEQVDNKQKT